MNRMLSKSLTRHTLGFKSRDRCVRGAPGHTIVIARTCCTSDNGFISNANHSFTKALVLLVQYNTIQYSFNEKVTSYWMRYFQAKVTSY